MIHSCAIVGSALALGMVAAAQKPANPISTRAPSVFLGPQQSYNDPVIYRDGGYEGRIGNTWYQIYADTTKCDSSGNNCYFVASNTVAASTFVATYVQDFPPTAGGPPPQFCNAGGNGSYRLQISGIVPQQWTTGAVWFHNLSSSDTGGNVNGRTISAGVGSVSYSGSTPICTPLQPFWDVRNGEPSWGIQALPPAVDGYIYLLGQLDQSVAGGSSNDVFLARVANGSTTNLGSYQYWNGTAFTPQRLVYPVLTNSQGQAIYAPASILQNVFAPSSFFYSTFYNKYVILSAPNTTDVYAHTASAPWGPWSDPVTIYKNTSYGLVGLYAPTAQTRFDPSGRNLTIVYSGPNGNTVDGVVNIFFK